ncbi:Ig-like domain-containing protein, partial [Floricoccus tropicus]|uniref:Ig-like domain-containing protein n=1 Tax=Floricoccus tropicus TaxID=1859473 RepID=UPI001E3167D8
KPTKPSDVTATPDKDGSVKIEGTTDPNTKVEITDKNGDVIGTGTSDNDGKFVIDIPADKNVKPGDTIGVTAGEEGNKSDKTDVTVPQLPLEKPTKPSDVTATPDKDGSVKIEGTTDPNTKVEITDKNG